jgi:hypothetical protein
MKLDQECFIVRDADDRSGLRLAYVYFEDEPGRRSAKVADCYIAVTA